MTFSEFIMHTSDDVLLADGLDAAAIGVAYSAGTEARVVYDITKVIDILVSRDGMSREEAQEFFDFNIVSAYVGSRTPVFIEKFDDVE